MLLGPGSPTSKLPALDPDGCTLLAQYNKGNGLMIVLFGGKLLEWRKMKLVSLEIYASEILHAINSEFFFEQPL